MKIILFFLHICKRPHMGAYGLKEFYFCVIWEQIRNKRVIDTTQVNQAGTRSGNFRFVVRRFSVRFPTGTKAILRFSRGCTRRHHAIDGIILQLGHDRFLPSSSEFVSHATVLDADTVLKITQRRGNYKRNK
jgi:hypothetical protein